MKSILKRSFFILISFLFIYGCTEPYALQTNTFEEAIVVEATITNELKRQEIKISKTYKLEENRPTLEKNATVYIKDDLGNQYNFDEDESVYLSQVPFQAVANRNYKLYITTSKGINYESNQQQLTTINQIESLTTTESTKNGEKGIQISVNNYDPTNTSKYYRYTFEETSKITMPNWNANNAVLIETPGEEYYNYPIAIKQRVGESKTCYTTKKSIETLLENTNDQPEDRVNNFPIRFIKSNDYTIAERYSIIITQYIQNLESYTFYNTLKKISGSGSLLSQTQPGAIAGNITSSNSSNKVVGFFEVSSISKKRIFFNFNEVLPNDPIPSYFTTCDVLQFDSEDYNPYDSPSRSPAGKLRAGILGKTLLYQDSQFSIYFMVRPKCSDCTTFSSNLKPSFWID